MRVTYQNYFRGFTKNQPFAISITNSAFPETSNNDPTSGSTPAVLRPARQASVESVEKGHFKQKSMS
jgi:hypothetical protein